MSQSGVQNSYGTPQNVVGHTVDIPMTAPPTVGGHLGGAGSSVSNSVNSPTSPPVVQSASVPSVQSPSSPGIGITNVPVFNASVEPPKFSLKRNVNDSNYTGLNNKV